MYLSRALERSGERTNSTLSNWHIVGAVQVQKSQCVFRAMVYVSITANAGYR